MSSNNNYRFTDLPKDTNIQEIESHIDNVIEALGRADYKYFQFDGDIANIVFNRHQAVEVVLKQVKIMGSHELYKIIDNNLRHMKFERWYTRAQFLLFAWRYHFFKKIYPSHNGDSKTTPRTLQVMLNFDVVNVLACSKFPSDKLHFDSFGPCQICRWKKSSAIIITIHYAPETFKM